MERSIEVIIKYIERDLDAKKEMHSYYAGLPGGTRKPEESANRRVHVTPQRPLHSTAAPERLAWCLLQSYQSFGA